MDLQGETTNGASGTNGHAATPPARKERQTLVLELEVDAIERSRTNPRRTFNDAELGELAADVERRGVLQPILVRASPTSRASEGIHYELVFGERRWRAAKLAGLTTIPAMVRVLSDQEVLEIQIVENSKRSDVHPLEEADGYKMLHELHGVSIEDIAAKLGRSVAFVYGRLKFCALVTEARTAFLEGKLAPGAALVLARIPHEDVQRKATAELLKRYDAEDGPISQREASDIVQRQFMLRLADAPFDRADAALLPVAGACSSCPKRTGAQRELFSDVEASDDLCTDEKCFAEKRDAAWKIKAARAKEQGRTILEGKAAKELFPHGGTYLDSAKLVDLDATTYLNGKQRTYRQLLGKEAESQATLVRDPAGGIRELVPRSAVAKLEKESRSSGSSPAADAKQREEREREKVRELGNRAVRDAIARAASSPTRRPSEEGLRIVLKYIVDAGYARADAQKELAARYELKATELNAFRREVVQVGNDRTGPRLFALVLDVALTLSGDEDVLGHLATIYGIDRKAVAKAGASWRPEAKKAPAKKAAKKAASAAKAPRKKKLR